MKQIKAQSIQAKFPIILTLFALLTALSAKPIVSVSIAPQAYFLHQIAGETLTIHTLVPQGIDPHTFEFKPSNLYQLQKSDLYLTIGLEFEEMWLPKLRDNLKQTKIMAITQNISFIRQTHDHELHEDDHAHAHDPHIWLSPALVKILARNIASILSEHFPEHQALYQANLDKFLQKISLLQEKIQSQLASLKNRTFLVYHPAWSYFAQEFNLKEIAIQVDEKEPTPQELALTIALAKKEKIKTLFIQSGFSTQSISIITESCDATPWVSDPLAYEWEEELLNFTQGLLH